MPKRDLIVRLDDIDKMIGKVEDMQKEIGTLDAFKRSIPFQLAFERAYEIIGEALYKIKKEFDPSGITDLDKIVSLRHLLAHDYFKVDHELLWAFTEKFLPLLKQQIREALINEKIRLIVSADPKLDI
ncbi:MAG TPA: HepT-like ribonuclease domain-containing protein [Phnomibacter sp.]|nr:HepT-like ribonuclease domain-containing protein [Phnomibacter sp.]